MQNQRQSITLILFFLAHFFSLKTNAQQCSLGIPPTTITVQCGSACLPLSFIVPDIRETSDYIALDLPYNPYLFESRSDPAVIFASPPQWPGNSYSQKYNLPFIFCFFDSLYDYLIVGSNGCVSFDTSMALKWCEPRLINTLTNRIVPLPDPYYARALIAGVMQDLDPFDTARVVSGEKVEYRVEGTAPCRKVIISYNKIPLWPGLFGNCQSSINTYQIVLHESTGIIDVYEKDKPPCTGSNNGIAIIGVQNWARDHAVAPRNRNGFNWGGTNINEAFRFLPGGGNSRFVEAIIHDGFRVIATTTTATPGALGELNVQFSSVCPSSTSNFLILETVYSACTGTGQISFYDTVFVNHNTTLNATAQTVPPSCGGINGSIIVHVPGSGSTPPLQYSINGGPLQADSVFAGLAAGTYTIFVQDNGGCSKSFLVNLVGSNVLVTSIAVDTPSCNAASDGRIRVSVLNGNPPFQYSINGGPVQASNIFTGLSPGTYSINVFDATGCLSPTQNVTVPQGPPLAVTIQTTTTSCAGANNGTITVTPTNGTAPYQYSLNGGPFQAQNVFTNLAVGNYTIHVTDGSGCNINNVPAQVQQGQPLNPSVVKTDVSCNGGNNGIITVSVSNGTTPFQYSLDGTNYQTSNIFNGLTAGSYTVYVKDNNTCNGTVSVIISQPSALTVAATSQDVRCNGETNGSISITAGGGISPYQYSLNGTSFQANNSFNNLTAGNYTVYVKDNNGCITTKTIAVIQPQQLQVNTATQNASCGGGNDGKITVIASGGNNNNYQYSIDGINFQPFNIFNVAPGVYTITVKDIYGCSVTEPGITVGLNNTLAIKTINDTIICLSRSVNLNAISNATQYNWSPTTGLSSTTIANPVASPTTTTTYIVNAVLGPCAGKDTVMITVLPAPVADAGNDGRICFGDSIQLNGSGGVNYQWSPSSSLSNSATANPFAKPKQTISYNLAVTDVNGCTSLAPDAVTVTVIQPVRVNITPDTYVSPGNTVQLHSEGGISYNWTPTTGLNNPSIPDPLATITQDITYKVIVTTADGCKTEDSVTIKAYKGPDIYVPTAFTPNHDGKNDRFIPIPVGIKELNYFKVYNRWGQLLYSTSQLREGWDGRFSGIEQDSGVYIWIVRGITNDNKIIFKKGTVVLIR